MNMPRHVLLFYCMLLLGLTVAAESAQPRVPPGSFVTKPVSTPAQLADLVKQDRVAALRYSKHFGMEPAALQEYFRNNLSVSSLDKTRTFTVYYIAQNGRIIPHQKRLKAGTKVFTAFNGQPVLDVTCGNPLTKTLPKVVAQKPVVEAVKPAPEPVPVVQPTAPEPEPVQVAEAPVAPEPVKVEVLAEPPTELPAPTAPPISMVKSTGWLLPGLLGAGAIGALSGGRDEPVPEPTGVLVLTIGGMGLLVSAFKRRHRH